MRTPGSRFLHPSGDGPKCRAVAITGLTAVRMEARTMLPKWLMALLVLLQEAWSTRRDTHIRFLKLQVEMLKDRLPGNRVILDPVERRRLMFDSPARSHGRPEPSPTYCPGSVRAFGPHHDTPTRSGVKCGGTPNRTAGTSPSAPSRWPLYMDGGLLRGNPGCKRRGRCMRLPGTQRNAASRASGRRVVLRDVADELTQPCVCVDAAACRRRPEPGSPSCRVPE